MPNLQQVPARIISLHSTIKSAHIAMCQWCYMNIGDYYGMNDWGSYGMNNGGYEYVTSQYIPLSESSFDIFESSSSGFGPRNARSRFSRNLKTPACASLVRLILVTAFHAITYISLKDTPFRISGTSGTPWTGMMSGDRLLLGQQWDFQVEA